MLQPSWSETQRCESRAIAALAALIVCDASAQAAPPSFRMHWNAPDQCAPSQQFDGKLRALLGGDPEAILSSPLSVNANIWRTVLGHWRVELSFTEQEVTRIRQLTAQSCAELSDAAALLVALAVDPSVEMRLVNAETVGAQGSVLVTPSASSPSGDLSQARPQITPPASTKDTTSTPPSRDAEIPTASTRSWARLHPFLGLGPAMSLGVLPAAGFGGHVVGGFQSPHLRLALEARLLASRPANLPGVADAHADLYSWTIGFVPCWLVSFGSSVSLGPCAAAELGILWGHGEGLEGTRSAEKPWGALRLGAHAEVQLSQRLRFVVTGDVGAPFGQPNFLLAGEQVHRPSSTILGFGIVGEMHFQ